MGIKEQVKKGQLTAAEAQNRVSPESKTYAWLERRVQRAKVKSKKGGAL